MASEFATIAATLHSLLSERFFGNSLWQYLLAMGVALGGLLLVALLKKLLYGRMRRRFKAALAEKATVEAPSTGSKPRRINNELLQAVFASGLHLLRLLPIYWAFTILSFPPSVLRAIQVTFLLLFTWRAVQFIANLTVTFIDSLMRGDAAKASRKAITPIIKGVIWLVGIVFVLDNLGMHISSIVAGLGIMGVAVGLAGQAILADFFGYLIILLDRPFSIGDFLVVGTSSGTVEYIGVKTTHVRSLTGELLVLPNSELTRKEVRNFRQIAERSRTFRFGVTYATPVEKLRAIPETINNIVMEIPGCSLARAHFINFGDSSLDFEVMFKINAADYTTLLDAQQRINLGLLERLAVQGIEFAYPTRTVYMAESGKTDT